jgi:hypothetical protein
MVDALELDEDLGHSTPRMAMTAPMIARQINAKIAKSMLFPQPPDHDLGKLPGEALNQCNRGASQ